MILMHGTLNLIYAVPPCLPKCYIKELCLNRKVLKVSCNGLPISLTSASHLMIITESPGCIRASQSWYSIKFKFGCFHQANACILLWNLCLIYWSLQRFMHVVLKDTCKIYFRPKKKKSKGGFFGAPTTPKSPS